MNRVITCARFEYYQKSSTHLVPCNHFIQYGGSVDWSCGSEIVAVLSLAVLSVVLLPIFLFAVLHSASYSLTLLDVSTSTTVLRNSSCLGHFGYSFNDLLIFVLQTLGQNSWWGARLMISLVEFQSRNILRLVAFTEIFLMPFTIVLIFL
jgi:hypothetical protein